MPSDLFAKYDCEGGFTKLEFDLCIAAEISERITEQHAEANNRKPNAKRAVSRRNQKRQQRQQQLTSKEMGNIVGDWMDE